MCKVLKKSHYKFFFHGITLRKPRRNLGTANRAEIRHSIGPLVKPKPIVTCSHAFSRVFPRLTPVTCIGFEFWLVHCAACVCCDWPYRVKVLVSRHPIEKPCKNRSRPALNINITKCLYSLVRLCLISRANTAACLWILQSKYRNTEVHCKVAYYVGIHYGTFMKQAIPRAFLLLLLR